MIKMKDNNENKNKNSFTESQKEGIYAIPLNLNKEKYSTFPEKEKKSIKNKKTVSMNKIFADNKKISININQNLNINSNINGIAQSIENKEKSSMPKTDNPKNKTNNKLKTFILAYDSDKIVKNNDLILSVKLSKRKSHEVESSFKIENILDNNLKLETSCDKQEQFIEFNINDNIGNKMYKLKNNWINTSKYNIFTFIPKGLLFQFYRLSNVYFLFTAIIQSIPLISPITSVTAIVPLIFVLGVSLTILNLV